MTIWQCDVTTTMANDRAQDSMSHYLGIEFIEVGSDYLTASMPIEQKVKQPIGIMHGGASCVLAETVGSTAANYCVDQKTHYCVGVDINTNHIRSMREGKVIATARPFHLGKTTQVWGIDIHNEEGKLVSVNRLTMAVLKRA